MNKRSNVTDIHAQESKALLQAPSKVPVIEMQVKPDRWDAAIDMMLKSEVEVRYESIYGDETTVVDRMASD